MKVTFLGTGGAFPTAERNATAHAVQIGSETVLLDCGEGTQRQLRRSARRFTIDRIFLSHLHLDHVLGLPGYVWTLQLLRREAPLRVYTPLGTGDDVRRLIGPLERLDYSVSILELDEGDVVDTPEYRVSVARVDHAGACLAYRLDERPRPGQVDLARAQAVGLTPGPLLGRLVRGEPVEIDGRTILPAEVVGPPRPGRSLVFSGDTRPCAGLETLARGADLLIHEAMYTTALMDEAERRAHSTAAGAAGIARAAGVRLLALTHVSQRHQDADGIRQIRLEAQELFPDAFVPDDLDELEIPLS